MSKAAISFLSSNATKLAFSRVDDAIASLMATTSTLKLISGVAVGEAAAAERRPARMMEIFMVVVVKF
jgi:hypothetical protein